MTHESSIDVIVTIATGYQDVDQYRQFVSTLRRTGATCPVLIGISDGPEYELVKRYLLKNAVNYFIVPRALSIAALRRITDNAVSPDSDVSTIFAARESQMAEPRQFTSHHNSMF